MSMDFLTEPITLQQAGHSRLHIKIRLIVATVMAALFVATATFASHLTSTVLEKIDVITNRYGTELKLHAERPIQHQVLKASDTELIIKFSGVASANTIKTDFSQAQQVSHVIFQPDGHDTLRLTIRGKSLGQPVIQVVYPPVARQVAQKPLTSLPQPTQIPEPEETSLFEQPNQTVASLSQEATESTSLLSAIQAHPEQTAGPSATTPEPVSTFKKETTPEPILFDSEVDAEEPLMPSAVAASPSTMDMFIEQLQRALGGIDAGKTLFTVSAMLLLLGSLGFFLKHKWNTLQGMTQSMGRKKTTGRRRSSVRELMRQQRENGTNDVIDDEEEHFSPKRHPKKANAWKSRPNTRVNQPMNQQISEARRATSRPASNGRPRQSKTGVQHALNSYQKANTAPKKPINRADAVNQSNPIAGNSDNPLPNNPRITNFLKDVAQYMEKDGQSSKAKRIQRNIPKD